MFKKVLLSILTISMIAIPVFVLAEVPIPDPGPEVRKEPLMDFIGSIIRVGLGLIGAVLLILILYGGFTYATAAGNEEKVKKGRNILTYAVIGMVIIAAAWILTDFIISNVLVGSSE